MGGRYIDLPTWQGLLGKKKLVVVHPLGGCPVGDTHETWVVNEFGQVFDASKPAASKAVLKDLYVADGAVIPGALAANPSLTISAKAQSRLRIGKTTGAHRWQTKTERCY